MKWYLAKIVFRIICGTGKHTPQFDEQLRLVAAESAEMAFMKAVGLGKAGEDSFFNMQQQLVQWKFVNVAEIIHLHEMTDGAEMYSAIKEADDATQYESSIHARAQHIKKNCEGMLAAQA